MRMNKIVLAALRCKGTVARLDRASGLFASKPFRFQHSCRAYTTDGFVASPFQKSRFFKNFRSRGNWLLADAVAVGPESIHRKYSSTVAVAPVTASGESTSIHPTAIVCTGATIGKGVVIGPYCTVGEDSKLGNHVHLHAGCHISGNTELGEGCVVLNGAIVGANIPGSTVIGKNNIIGHHSVVGAKCQDLKYRDGDDCFLFIGDNNDIREFCSIHRSSKPSEQTIIGSNNLIMGSCHVGHDCKVGDHNILSNGVLLAGHVKVEKYVRIGGGVAVHQFCNLGAFCFVGGGSMVSNDIPNYTMVAGNRAEVRGLNFNGLQRHGFLDFEVKSLKRAYQKIFMSRDEKGGLEARLVELEENEELMNVSVVSSFIKSIRDSYKENRRGICTYRSYVYSG